MSQREVATRRLATSDTTWNFADAAEFARHVQQGMPPLIVTCACTGDHRKRDHPSLPTSAAEQAEVAMAAFAAGARIIHIHGRDAGDPDRTSHDPQRYLRINEEMRAAAPEILIDNTQTVAEVAIDPHEILGKVHYYKSAPLTAKPDLMALNPGPMTFRGTAEWPSGVTITTFDETERTAYALREAGIKPQVFLYHPGHLDLLEYLIAKQALDAPYFVQLVFGQQSGINAGPDSVLYMLRNLPPGCVFQTCALGLLAIQVHTLALLLGGHARTGLEDSLLYQKDQPAVDNAQLVARVVRIAHELGRRVATPAETRAMLGLPQRDV
jgi:3-keto-5-aminohexanoate cleavage enzyme